MKSNLALRFNDLLTMTYDCKANNVDYTTCL